MYLFKENVFMLAWIYFENITVLTSIKIISLKAKLKYYELSNHCQLLVATLNRFSP